MTRDGLSLGIGIIGAGWFGERHAQAIADAGAGRLVGACSADPQGLARFTSRHGGRAYPGITELLADPGIDAVVIATPHHLHEAHALAASAAGKHILLEKPMAPSRSACERIIAAAAKNGIVLTIGLTQRFAAPVIAAKAMLDSGELGAVRYARAAMLKLWMEPNRQAWHLDPACDGGMLFTAGIHALDSLLWLVGEPASSIYAVVTTRFHDMPVDDLAEMIIRFRSGAIGSVTSLAYRDGAPSGGIDLVCDRGTMNVDPGRGVRVGQGGVWREVKLQQSDDVMRDALAEEWRAFRRAIITGETPVADGDAGRDVVACIEAAFESSRRSREIEIVP